MSGFGNVGTQEHQDSGTPRSENTGMGNVGIWEHRYLGILGFGNPGIGKAGIWEFQDSGMLGIPGSRALTEALQTESAWNLLKLLLLYTGSPFRKSAWGDTIPKKTPQGETQFPKKNPSGRVRIPKENPQGRVDRSQRFVSIQSPKFQGFEQKIPRIWAAPSFPRENSQGDPKVAIPNLWDIWECC